MQVNSGKNKGTKLFSPVGEDVRPTTDKVKQAIFNMIYIGMLNGNALDLFAGSGAMGIEALSRGCDFCDFSDLDTTYVEKNIEKCNLSQKCYIFKGSFEKLIFSSKRKYSYVFLDPPYHKGLIEKALFLLTSKKLLNDGAVIVMESDFDEDFKIPNQIQIIKEKTYGRIRVKIGEFKEVQ